MPSSPARAALVVLNSGSGTGSATDERAAIEAQFAAADIGVRFVTLEPGLDLPDAVDRHRADGVTLVVAAGGDGTVNAVANAIIGRDVHLGVLPLGTLNHFARDLGIPLDTAEALAVIIAGHTSRVDAAQVNGRTFLNNSSVGLYPRIVRLRERYKARGIEKWAVAAWATLKVTRKGRPLRVQLTADERQVTRTTPLVFIGNNEYRMAGFEAATRESVQQGTLALYVVKVHGRWQLLRLVWRILARTAQASGELAMVRTLSATIDVPDDPHVTRLEVATDGEVALMDLPLEYRILPGALAVCVPAGIA